MFWAKKEAAVAKFLADQGGAGRRKTAVKRQTDLWWARAKIWKQILVMDNIMSWMADQDEFVKKKKNVGDKNDDRRSCWPGWEHCSSIVQYMLCGPPPLSWPIERHIKCFLLATQTYRHQHHCPQRGLMSILCSSWMCLLPLRGKFWAFYFNLTFISL